jgi:Flp pilus assembly protein TadB
MSETTRLQPRWGRALGSLVAVVVLIAMTRGAWEVVVATVVIALLVGGYLLQRRARRRTVHGDEQR